MNETESAAIAVARKTAAAFSALPSVEAVALGGSQVAGPVDADSDIDLYVHTTAAIPLGDREVIIAKLGAVRPELNQTFWDVADAWRDGRTGCEVEAI